MAVNNHDSFDLDRLQISVASTDYSSPPFTIYSVVTLMILNGPGCASASANALSKLVPKVKITRARIAKTTFFKINNSFS